MKKVPRWTVASAASAPVLLIGGWALAEALQPPGYDPIRDTISALAAHGATDRWVMTFALGGLGTCHIITALGLSPARTLGRFVLAGGGMATILVATFPQPARANSMEHTVAATAAFIALGAWPLFAARQSSMGPLLTRSASTAAAVVMLGLSAWFAAELHGGQRGLSERAASGAQALWPLAVAVTSRRAFSKR